MNFQQLRIIRETVRQNFNLTEVANALYASQSGVSKHIKDLEDELGLELFIRKGKRFLGLTDPGKELLVIVERMLLDAANIRRLAEQFSQRDEGQLTIATTHTQARYALPRVVTAFKAAFPKVHLVLHQASPSELVRLLQEGEADIGIATEAVADVPELVSFPYYSWHHAVIAPPAHPLHQGPLTLEALADYPLITYHHGFTGRTRIDRTFADAGLNADIVMAALDADVIKAYVELGLAWASSPRWPSIPSATPTCRWWPANRCLATTPPASPCAVATICAATPTALLNCAPMCWTRRR